MRAILYLNRSSFNIYIGWYTDFRIFHVPHDAKTYYIQNEYLVSSINYFTPKWMKKTKINNKERCFKLLDQPQDDITISNA